MKSNALASLALPVAALALLGCDTPADPDPAPRATPLAAPSLSRVSEDRILQLAAEPDPFVRARELGALLPTLGPDSLPAVRASLRNAWLLELGAVEFELLMHFWALHEPEAAAHYALDESPRGYRVTATYAAVPHWVKTDPETAIPIVDQYTDLEGDWGSSALISLVRGWYASGHPGLEEHIRKYGAMSFKRQRALTTYAIAMIRDQGGAAVVGWAETALERDENYHLDVMRAAGKALASFDLDAARDFCARHCEEEYGSGVRSNIATRWGRHDPVGALEWLGTTPDAQDLNVAVMTIYSTWGLAEPGEASAWYSAQAEGGDPEKLPEYLKPTLDWHARFVAENAPLEAIRWAESVENERDREWAIMEALRVWRRNDEAAAEAWMDQSSLSEDALALLRAPGENWRDRRRHLREAEAKGAGADDAEGTRDDEASAGETTS